MSYCSLARKEIRQKRERSFLPTAVRSWKLKRKEKVCLKIAQILDKTPLKLDENLKVHQESWDFLKDKSIREDKLSRYGPRWLIWAIWRN